MTHWVKTRFLAFLHKEIGNPGETLKTQNTSREVKTNVMSKESKSWKLATNKLPECMVYILLLPTIASVSHVNRVHQEKTDPRRI